MVVQDLHHIL
jgi:DNA integrity scanning protein DisA with diadenylate cyclase activity